MSCNKCRKSPCCCGNSSTNGTQASDVANALAQLAEQQEAIDQIKNSLGALLNGHPILLVEHPDDIAEFDLSSGVGSGNWTGWGICNGQQYSVPGSTSKITTPNMTDRVPVGAGGQYAVDDVVGSDTIVLTVGQLPAHNHGVTDPGHTHTITDPGHNHGVTDPGHNHAGSSDPHDHTLTIIATGDHNHSIPEVVNLIGSGGSGAYAANSPVTYGNSGNAGAHTHTGTADDRTVTVNIDNAFTGIVIQNDYTGLSIDSATTGVTTNNTGSGDDVDVRQPSYAVFFAMKIF